MSDNLKFTITQILMMGAAVQRLITVYYSRASGCEQAKREVNICKYVLCKSNSRASAS